MPHLVIRNVSYLGQVTNLLVGERGVTPATTEKLPDLRTIEATGLIAVPGLVDVHVHFRDPGFTAKEEVMTGARAAAAGGFCAVLCEPNTHPVIDTPAAVTKFNDYVKTMSVPITVLTKAAVTMGQQGKKMTEIAALAEAGAAALSDDGEPLVDRDLLVEAFREAGDTLVITAHCEETPKSADKVRAALGDGVAMTRETELIRLHLEALERAGAGLLHIQHVSLAESALLIARAKRQGLAVTAEVTPHHLLLCAEDVPSRNGDGDPNWKMNPPLRSRADMLAMRQALAEGVIDIIATDHAPHTHAEKARSWRDAPFGVVGLETALGAALSLVHDGTLTFEQLSNAMGKHPHGICPQLSAQRNHLTLIDPRQTWIVDPATFHSKGRNCPFAGRTFKGKAVYTIANGRVVMAEGEVLF